MPRDTSEWVASPPFSVYLPSIAANGMHVVDWASTDRRSMSYLPFNSALIVNNSTSDIEIWVNQDENHKIPVVANSIMRLLPSDASIFSFKILNKGTTDIQANQIMITCSRINTTDAVISRVVERFFR
jgi:hypothetical protein